MKKRLYYRDNYCEFPEGYVIALEKKGLSYEIALKAYVNANSRCANGCRFMTNKPVYVANGHGEVFEIQTGRC